VLVRHLSKMWNVGCRHTAKRAWIKQRKVPGELPGTGVWERIWVRGWWDAGFRDTPITVWTAPFLRFRLAL